MVGGRAETRIHCLQLMAQRVMRIYEGPSEIHRWVLARNQLRVGKQKPSNRLSKRVGLHCGLKNPDARGLTTRRSPPPRTGG